MDEEKAYTDSPDRIGGKLPLSSQEKAVAELHDVIAQLTSRLKPVLTPVPTEPSDGRSEDKASPVQSPLAEQMSTNTYGVHKGISKIRALMERLEC